MFGSVGHVTSTVHFRSSFPWCFMEVDREFILLPRDVCKVFFATSHLQWLELFLKGFNAQEQGRDDSHLIAFSVFSCLINYTNTLIWTGTVPRLLFSFLYCVSLCRMREDMSSVCAWRETDGQGTPERSCPRTSCYVGHGRSCRGWRRSVQNIRSSWRGWWHLALPQTEPGGSCCWGEDGHDPALYGDAGAGPQRSTGAVWKCFQSGMMVIVFFNTFACKP